MPTDSAPSISLGALKKRRAQIAASKTEYGRQILHCAGAITALDQVIAELEQPSTKAEAPAGAINANSRPAQS